MIASAATATCGSGTTTAAIQPWLQAVSRLTLRGNWAQIGAGRSDRRRFFRAGAPLSGMRFMRCSSRPSRAGKTGAVAGWSGSSRSRLCSPSRPCLSAQAQSMPTTRHADAHARRLRRLIKFRRYRLKHTPSANLGSNFLERLGNQATSGFGKALAKQSRRRRRFRKHGSAAVPQLGRGLRTFGHDRSAGLLRRRPPPHLWRRRGGRRARRARRQCRLFRRSEPHRHRHSAGAAVGNARSHPVRVQCLGRQGTVDLGHRAGSRLRQGQFEPRHRVRLRNRRLQRPPRRRADRTQLLLEPGPEPHRAEGRVRICARLDRIAAGDSAASIR